MTLGFVIKLLLLSNVLLQESHDGGMDKKKNNLEGTWLKILNT